MTDRTITVEATIHEPELQDDGSRTVPMMFLIASATLRRGRGRRNLLAGSNGGTLWLYLDDDRAVSVNAVQLYKAAQAALAVR